MKVKFIKFGRKVKVNDSTEEEAVLTAELEPVDQPDKAYDQLVEMLNRKLPRGG